MFRIFFFLVFFKISLSGYGQFHVSEGTTLSLVNSNAIVSSLESVNTINGNIEGVGTFALSEAKQQLNSHKHILILPSVLIADATEVIINVPLEITHQFTVAKGILLLTKSLQLTNKQALNIQVNAFLLQSTEGLLHFKTNQILPFKPLTTVSFQNSMDIGAFPSYSFHPFLVRNKNSLFSSMMAVLNWNYHQNIPTLPPQA